MQTNGPILHPWFLLNLLSAHWDGSPRVFQSWNSPWYAPFYLGPLPLRSPTSLSAWGYSTAEPSCASERSRWGRDQLAPVKTSDLLLHSMKPAPGRGSNCILTRRGWSLCRETNPLGKIWVKPCYSHCFLNSKQISRSVFSTATTIVFKEAPSKFRKNLHRSIAFSVATGKSRIGSVKTWLGVLRLYLLCCYFHLEDLNFLHSQGLRKLE